jgi:hypothetical protein
MRTFLARGMFEVSQNVAAALVEGGLPAADRDAEGEIDGDAECDTLAAADVGVAGDGDETTDGEGPADVTS